MGTWDNATRFSSFDGLPFAHCSMDHNIHIQESLKAGSFDQNQRDLERVLMVNTKVKTKLIVH